MAPRPSDGRGLRSVSFWILAAVGSTAVGAALGFAIHGRSFAPFLWLVPGIVLVVVAVEKIERYRRRSFRTWTRRLVALCLFFPAFAIGAGIGEAVG